MALLLFAISAWIFVFPKEKLANSVYHLEEGANFIKMEIPIDNPLTVEGVKLGRKLFFDPVLSKNGSLSCATCHNPQKAFSDGLPKSNGAAGLQTNRSTPSLVNIGYHHNGLFWDGGIRSLEEQVLQSVENPTELAGSWEDVLDLIRSDGSYVDQFKIAFGLNKPMDITKEVVAKAIAQYERSLVSYNSKYDQYLAGSEQLDTLEERGRIIFFDASEEISTGECAHCHGGALFSDLLYFNNGLEEAMDLSKLKDIGRGAISKKYYDNGKFKAPTLRNIALTAPYMHDGRFKTLEEVIEHYDKGGHYAENVSPNVRPLGLSKLDKKSLIAFLHTLTDTVSLRKELVFSQKEEH